THRDLHSFPTRRSSDLHVSFGRMDKRYEEMANLRLVNTIETLTGMPLSHEQRTTIVKGASELELVNSGLEDTMISAYHEIREVKNSKKEIDSLRTAALIGAINKIAVSYQNLGIWP